MFLTLLLLLVLVTFMLFVHSVVKPPRKGEGETVGVFACRSPHRPNAIGLTLVAIDSIDYANNVVHISGLDLLDGSPVFDIKPYLATDAVPGTLDYHASSERDADSDCRTVPKRLRLPHWVQKETQQAEDFKVLFDPLAQISICNVEALSPRVTESGLVNNIRDLIGQLLMLDPTRGVKPASAKDEVFMS